MWLDVATTVTESINVFSYSGAKAENKKLSTAIGRHGRENDTMTRGDNMTRSNRFYSV